MLQYKELGKHCPDLLLHWLEAIVEGQARKYVRNAFSVIDPGEACDVVWTTLEEVYGREDLTIDNAMQLVRRPAKSAGHNRKVLLEFRADVRTLQGILVSLNNQSALESPKLLGSLYTALNDRFRSKFDAQHPSDQWTFDKFLEFFSNEISYVDSLKMMNVKIESKDESEAKAKYSGASRPAHVTKGSTYRPSQFAAVEKTVQLRKKSCVLHLTVTSHSLREWHKFLALEDSKRWEVAREHQLCFNCLKGDHHSRNCKEKAKCTQCHLFHHTLFHRSGHKSRSNTSSRGLKKEEEGSSDKHDAKPVTLGGVVNVDHQAIAKIGLMILTTPCKQSSQTKFRVVYDAAHNNQGLSLNQLLARGPIFMQSLQSIVIRFGEKRYGLASDISNIFSNGFQIRIHTGDQDMLRILWLD